jgi:site-specific recombinase
MATQRTTTPCTTLKKLAVFVAGEMSFACYWHLVYQRSVFEPKVRCDIYQKWRPCGQHCSTLYNRHMTANETNNTFQAALQAVFSQPATETTAEAATATLRFFVRLMAALRPRDPLNTAEITAAFTALHTLIGRSPTCRQQLRQHLRQLLRGTHQVTLYTDAGILPNSGFFTELWRRATGRLLPPVSDPRWLKDCFDAIFHRPDDHLWLAAAPLADIAALWQLLANDESIAAAAPDADSAERWRLHTEAQLLEAVQVLGTRIGAMGLEPELTRVQPRIAEFESPFVHLNAEVLHFTEAWKQHHADPTVLLDARHILVLVDQCREVIARARRSAASAGASLSLTFLLVRLEQSLARLLQLIGVLDAIAQGATAEAVSQWTRLLHDLIEGETRRHSVREPFRRLTALLALRITENASHTGEYYIATNRAEYAAMWRSAAGGGLIVGFIALVKMLLGKLVLAPLLWLTFYGLNYALGFVLIHVLNFTLATKQPAMTAATIAESIDRAEGRERDLQRLADLAVATLRTQFAAIVGNVAVVMPTGLLIAWAYRFLHGQTLIDANKAQHVLHDVSPLFSLSLPYAALTGVLLFAAGLISGYFDNKAAYDRIAERIAHLSWLRRALGAPRTERFAAYIGNNLGSLAGNFLLGILLASLAPLGVFLGLPLDVRHVTLSSANCAFALVTLHFQLSWLAWLEMFAGIALIGLVNLVVSFSLALLVALRAREADTRASRGLLKLLWQRLRREPLRFFVPPRD